MDFEKDEMFRLMTVKMSQWRQAARVSGTAEFGGGR